jgi:hypothetical protein
MVDKGTPANRDRNLAATAWLSTLLGPLPSLILWLVGRSDPHLPRTRRNGRSAFLFSLMAWTVWGIVYFAVLRPQPLTPENVQKGMLPAGVFAVILVLGAGVMSARIWHSAD